MREVKAVFALGILYSSALFAMDCSAIAENWLQVGAAVRDRRMTWVLKGEGGFGSKVLDIQRDEEGDSHIFSFKVEHLYRDFNSPVQRLVAEKAPPWDDPLYMEKLDLLSGPYHEDISRTRGLQDRLVGWATDFALSNMQSRRKNWPPSFIAKLRGMADQYKDQSIYFVVADNTSGKTTGVVRLIRSVYIDYREVQKGIADNVIDKLWTPRYLDPSLGGIYPFVDLEIDASKRDIIDLYFSNLIEGKKVEHNRPPSFLFSSPAKLPLEYYLNYQIDRPSVRVDPEKPYLGRVGQIFEVGNLAVDKSLPRKQRDQIFILLAKKVSNYVNSLNEDFPTRYLPSGQGFFAYADPASLKMYERLGLKPLTTKPITVDGVDWLPMGSAGVNADQLAQKIIEVKTSE
jgi:hypothetical protein